MKICMDILPISRLKNTGISNYTYEFLKRLTELYPSPSYDFIWDSSKHIPDFGKNKKISYLNLCVNRINNDFSSIEQHISNNKIDIYHCLNNCFSIPSDKKCHFISTVTNLLPAVNSNYVDEKYLKKFNFLFKESVKKCDKIIVVSKNLEKELIDLFHIDNNKIKTIYPGRSKIFQKKSPDQCYKLLTDKFNIKLPYILYSGSIHVRKNLEATLLAFKSIKVHIKNLSLVIAGNISGKRKQYYNKLKDMVNQLELDDCVFFIGDVEYELMPYLYSTAECVINLSKYEGFALSSIEAASCDTPVVCNNIPIFKEVWGNSTIIVEADDTKQVSENILNLIYNKNYRQSIINSQKDSLKKFNWDTSIKNTIKIYESFF